MRLLILYYKIIFFIFFSSIFKTAGVISLISKTQVSINPLASPSAGAPALKYGDVNTVTPSLGEVKGLIKRINLYNNINLILVITSV